MGKNSKVKHQQIWFRNNTKQDFLGQKFTPTDTSALLEKYVNSFKRKEIKTGKIIWKTVKEAKKC